MLSFAVFLLLLAQLTRCLTDYTLSCQRGYRISAIRRANSIHQSGRAGSLSIDCESILETDLDGVALL
jgi:hypothetical protein